MINFDEFTQLVINNIKNHLPDDFSEAEVKIDFIKKTGNSYHGVIVRKPEQTAVPVLNLEDAYTYYKNVDEDMDFILNEMAKVITANPVVDFPVDDINDYQKIKDRLFVRVCNYEANKENLDSAVFTRIEDLAMTYHFLVDNQLDNAVSSGMISEELLNNFGINKETLHSDALENSPKVMPKVIRKLGDMIGVPSQDKNFVVTNELSIDGAAALFYPGVLQQISGMVNGNYFVIPTSVDDVLILPDEEGFDYTVYEKILEDANANTLRPEQRLSKNVYYYDAVNRSFELAHTHFNRSNAAVFAHAPNDTGALRPQKQEDDIKLKAKNRAEFKENIAKLFIDSLEKNQMAWVRGWVAPSKIPYNYAGGNHYRGINRVWLTMVAEKYGYDDPRWMTYLQIQKMAAAKGVDMHVKKGETGCSVEYWMMMDRLKEKGDKKRFVTFLEAAEMIMKGEREHSDFEPRAFYSIVFNGSQIENMPELVLNNNDWIKQDNLVSTLSDSMGVPIINDGGDRAFYVPAKDTIHLPEMKYFSSEYSYNATALHELSHATGHQSRLNREQGFNPQKYAFEELVAEMAATMMATHLLGSEEGWDEYVKDHGKNHVSYVQSWIQEIKDNPNAIFDAVKLAENAVDYMEYKSGIITQENYLQKHKTGNQKELTDNLEQVQETIADITNVKEAGRAI